MRAAQELFYFELQSPLTAVQLGTLKQVTGMVIGDVHNPSKDTPGQGRITDRVFIRLVRGSEEDHWCIRAVGYDPREQDRLAAEVMREQLRRALNDIGTWDESGPR